MKSRYKVSHCLIPVIFLLSIVHFDGHGQPGVDLNRMIEMARAGDTIFVDPGRFTSLQIQDLHFSAEKPLVIKSVKQYGAVIKNNSISTGTALEVLNCSYIWFDGFVFEGGLWGIYVKSSNHLILTNNEVRGTGQEGIHIGYSSKYVDVIGNHVHDTGKTRPKWGEGIYVGSGSYGRNRSFPDNCEYVWIENNRVHDCGHGDGINIKGECFHITIIGNEVYNIAPGTEDQYNQAGISLESAGNSIEHNYRINEPRDIWVINNFVHDVSGGYADWDNGIMVTGTGSFIIGNKIRNCDNHGIYGNDWSALPLPNYLYKNDVQFCGVTDQYGSKLIIKRENPGQNPNSKQHWKE